MANGNGITSISLTDSGEHYRTSPIVRISEPDAEMKHASLSLTIDEGRISSINIDSAGTFYTTPPVITIDSATQSSITKFGDGALYHHTDTSRSSLHKFASTIPGTSGNGWEIGFWFYPTANSRNECLIHHPQLKMYRTSDNRMYVNVNDTTYIYSSASGLIQYNQWNYILFEYKDTGVRYGRLHVNGTLGSYVSSVSINLDQNDKFKLGASTADSSVQDNTLISFKGWIDNLVMDESNVWKTSQQVATLPTTALTGSIFTKNYEPVNATATATIENGRVSAINITDSGQNYLAHQPPSISVAMGQGTRASFKASIGVNFDSDAGKIESLYITDSGDFYVTAPTITIDDPVKVKDFKIGEIVTQDHGSNSVLEAEVSTWNDSDYKLSISHVGTVGNNNEFEEPKRGYWIVGQETQAAGYVTKVLEQDTKVDQNQEFNVIGGDLIDFTESNPFGEPDPDGHEH